MLQFAVPFSKQHKSINKTQRIQKEFVGDVLPTHYQVRIGREWENVPSHFRGEANKHTKPHKPKFTHHQNKSSVKPKSKAPHIKHITSDENENNAAHFARLEEEKAKERERIKEESLLRFQQDIKERVVRSERERRAAEFQKQVLIEQEIQRRAGHLNWERIGVQTGVENNNDSVLYDELLHQKNAEIDDVSLTFRNENNPSNTNYTSAHDGAVILHHTANNESLIDREVGDLFQTTQKAREALASCSLPAGPPNANISTSFDRSESNRETHSSKMTKEDKDYGVSSEKVVSLDDLNKVKLYRDVRNATLQREREKVRKILIQKQQNEIFKKMQEEEAKQIERDNLLKEQERLIQEMERNVLEEQERTKKEMQLADQKKKQIMAVNKERESERYEKALKFKFLDRLTSKHVPYPCQCSRRDPINHNTENCANNCLFYQNQKKYKAALVALLQIEQIEGIRV